MRILVLNTGSSSVKLSLIEAESSQVLLSGLMSWAHQRGDQEEGHPAHLLIEGGGKRSERELRVSGPGEAVHAALEELTRGDDPFIADRREVRAIGHRVVHGGTRFVQSQRVTPEVKAELERLVELAPLHNPSNLEGILAAEQAWPEAAQVACFDTAFHATLPTQAWTYPIPWQWTRDWGLRRYGFHGLSHAYCATRAAEMLGRGPGAARLVICHLGNGCSITAVRDGVSVDTSMGLTPLEGLMMGTRSGSVDPGLVIEVLRRHGLTAEQVDHALNHESGLLGVSGVSGDMRDVLKAAEGGGEEARLALAIYVERIRKAIGAMAAVLDGIDALVFTAGVGENAAEVRAGVCRGLDFLGLRLDAGANAGCRPDADVASPSSPGRILVIATREDLTIVRDVVQVLAEGS